MPGRRSYTGTGRHSKSRIGRIRKRHSKCTLRRLYKSISKDGWHDNTTQPRQEIQLYKVQRQSDGEPIVITMCLLIAKNCTWRVYVHGRLVDSCPALSEIPQVLTKKDASNLMSKLNNLNVCVGQPDAKFVDVCAAKNGQILSHNKQVVAYLDSTACVSDGQMYTKTVRHAECEMLVIGSCCNKCAGYRDNLRAISRNHSLRKTQTKYSKHTNLRYMRSPQKECRLRVLQQSLRNKKRQLQRLKSKLKKLMAKEGLEISEELQSDLQLVICHHRSQIEELSSNDFRKIFWKQQVAALTAKKNTSVRWHPLFIRWCLSIMLSSPKTYDIIRDSEFISLPCRRTLRDYTNWVKAEPGFQPEITSLLLKEAKVDALSDSKRHVVLLMDEMKVREDLVFDTNGEVIGYVDIGDINNQLKKLEKSCKVTDGADDAAELATHILCIMVRGIFIKLEFPLAHFPTHDVTGSQLHDIVWGSIRRLHEIGLNVICVVADGAKPNRRFMKDHSHKEGTKNGIVYKARNIYNPSMFIYFISDVPHLIKTTRNCWLSSQFGGVRCLWINGEHILWAHLHQLCDKCQAESGLYIGNKLRHEHLSLTSYSKMNVRLAAQVLSKSVADCFSTVRELGLGLQDTKETERFCRMFDKFFDCMNTRNLKEAAQKRKPDLQPYFSSSDIRLKWLKEDFLGYLNEWEDSVKARKDVQSANKKRMLLSTETLEGLRMTVYSFTEMAEYLLTLKGVEFLLSEKFNQDPLEIYFSKQRSRGARGDNPSVQQCLQNAQAIRAAKTLTLGNCSNIRKRKANHNIKELSAPLPKRRPLHPVNY